MREHRNNRRAHGGWVAGLALAAAVWGAMPALGQTSRPATAPAADAAAKQLLSDVFVDAAYERARDSSLAATTAEDMRAAAREAGPTSLKFNEYKDTAEKLVQRSQLSARQTFDLLKAAQRLTPDSPLVNRLMVEAASAVGDNAAHVEALQRVVAGHPGNLVAQVRLLDAVVRGKPVDEQLKVYQAAFGQTKLDPQVRSEVAVRIGRLLAERGSRDEARDAYMQAITLNDVNVAAWQEFCKDLVARNVAADVRLQGFIGLLMANPFQPDALVMGGRVLEHAGQHSYAANWLIAALEQFNLRGMQPVPLYWELAVELAISGRRAESEAFLRDLQNAPGSPSDVPMVAYMLKTGGVVEDRPAATTQAASQPNADDPLLTEMRKRFEDAAKTAQGDAADQLMLSRVWAEMLVAPTVAPRVDEWIATLRGKLGPENATYKRLAGWRLLRDGKLAEAKAALEPLAGSDPWAKFGLVRAAVTEKDTARVAALLQEMWSAEPQGILALEVALAAQTNHVELKDSAMGTAVKAAAGRYPADLLTAHRRITNMLLATAAPDKRRFVIGEPMMVNLRITNISDRAMSAGPGGALSTSVAIGGNVRGLDAADLGYFAFDDQPRVYRVNMRDSLEIKLRADYSVLRDYLYANPTRLVTVSLGAVTAPRAARQQRDDRFIEVIVPGLGGLKVDAGAMDREGVNANDLEGLVQFSADLPRLAEDKQMLLSTVLMMVVPTIPDDEKVPELPANAPPSMPKPTLSPAEAKRRLVTALTREIKESSPLVQAWILHYSRRQLSAGQNYPAELQQVLGQLPDSKDPLVRMLAFRQALLQVAGMPERRLAVAKVLREQAGREEDRLVRDWMQLVASEAEQQMPPPAPAPTSAP